jgi:hypothetical protein
MKERVYLKLSTKFPKPPVSDMHILGEQMVPTLKITLILQIHC